MENVSEQRLELSRMESVSEQRLELIRMENASEQRLEPKQMSKKKTKINIDIEEIDII
jgi:hypothetical protein